MFKPYEAKSRPSNPFLSVWSSIDGKFPENHYDVFDIVQNCVAVQWLTIIVLARIPIKDD